MTNSKRVSISLATSGHKYAADDARSTGEGQETPLHTSGGVPRVAANHLVSVGLEGNAGSVAEMRNIFKMVYISSWYFWHSEGWRVRNEALMSRMLKMVANARSHWIIVRDAIMDPTEFANGDWVNNSKAKV